MSSSGEEEGENPLEENREPTMMRKAHSPRSNDLSEWWRGRSRINSERQELETVTVLVIFYGSRVICYGTRKVDTQ